MKKQLIERFAPKYQVNKSSGCWEWTASKDRRNYGMFYPGYGKNKIGAHRVSWTIHRGEIPKGLHVLHRCDNPLCVNPDHLWLGTHADNMADKDRKGRARNDLKGRPGEKHGGAKLNEEKVLLARKLRSEGLTYRAIGEQLGVSLYAIYDVCHRRWRHI